jgi:hypothetical protein
VVLHAVADYGVLLVPDLFRSPPPLPEFVRDPWLLPTVPSPEVVLVEIEEPAPPVLPSLIAPVDSPLFVVLELAAVLFPGVVDVCLGKSGGRCGKA